MRGKNSHYSVFLRLLTMLAVISLVTVSRSLRASWAERAGKMNRTKLSEQEARAKSEKGQQERRNKLAMRRINPSMEGVDWNADPTAIPYMLYQVNKRTDLPVYVDNDGLKVATDELFEFTIVYLTSHTRWSFNEKETANMQRFLRRGGTLLLDDCYNRGSAFTDSVRPEVAKMIPGAEPTMLLKDDSRVEDVFRMVYETPWPGEAGRFPNKPWQYFLLDGRPAVFFSPNDDGCGWEVSTPPTASNPIGEGIGHGGDNRQRELMYQWATNWMLYAYTH
ncbi:MAG: DUF4159 domain-containing protein [Candidatus Brocadiia bacterium]